MNKIRYLFNMKDLEQKVIKWASDRNILMPDNADKQLIKTF